MDPLHLKGKGGSAAMRGEGVVGASCRRLRVAPRAWQLIGPPPLHLRRLVFITRNPPHRLLRQTCRDAGPGATIGTTGTGVPCPSCQRPAWAHIAGIIWHAPRERRPFPAGQGWRITPSPPREATGRRPLRGYPTDGGDDAKRIWQSHVRGGLPILVIKDWDRARPGEGREDASLFCA